MFVLLLTVDMYVMNFVSMNFLGYKINVAPHLLGMLSQIGASFHDARLWDGT